MAKLGRFRATSGPSGPSLFVSGRTSADFGGRLPQIGRSRAKFGQLGIQFCQSRAQHRSDRVLNRTLDTASVSLAAVRKMTEQYTREDLGLSSGRRPPKLANVGGSLAKLRRLSMDLGGRRPQVTPTGSLVYFSSILSNICPVFVSRPARQRGMQRAFCEQCFATPGARRSQNYMATQDQPDHEWGRGAPGT